MSRALLQIQRLLEFRSKPYCQQDFGLIRATSELSDDKFYFDKEGVDFIEGLLLKREQNKNAYSVRKKKRQKGSE